LQAKASPQRNALHGVTALLEARTALQQGERIKTLSYLATLYLPLTATASIYSMSVLPSSTTFYSFFLVLAGLVALTITTGAYLPSLRANALPALILFVQPSAHALSSAFASVGLSAYFRGIFYLLTGSHRRGSPMIGREWNRRTEGCLMRCLMLVPLLVRGLPERLVSLLVAEITFPRDQLVMAQYIGNRYVNYQWHPLAFVRDAGRLLLLPVWVGIVAGLVVYIMVFDLALSISSVLFWMLVMLFQLMHRCFRRKQ
jgi:hypothetical protein